MELTLSEPPSISLTKLRHNLNIAFLKFREHLYDNDEQFALSLKELMEYLEGIPKTPKTAKMVTLRLISIFVDRPIYKIFDSNNHFIEIIWKNKPKTHLIPSFSRTISIQFPNSELQISLETFHKKHTYTDFLDNNDDKSSILIVIPIQSYNITFILNLFDLFGLDTQYLQ